MNVTGPAPVRHDDSASGRTSSDPGILRTAAEHNRAHVGLYAAVLRGGAIRRGDPIRID